MVVNTIWLWKAKKIAEKKFHYIWKYDHPSDNLSVNILSVCDLSVDLHNYIGHEIELLFSFFSSLISDFTFWNITFQLFNLYDFFLHRLFVAFIIHFPRPYKNKLHNQNYADQRPIIHNIAGGFVSIGSWQSKCRIWQKLQWSINGEL